MGKNNPKTPSAKIPKEFGKTIPVSEIFGEPLPKQPVGRPRTRTPSPEELIELGKDLVQWATEESNELRCRFCEWYSLKQRILGDDWELMIRKPEFIGYYETARVALAKRFIDGSVNPSIAHRFLRIYCPEVKIDDESKAEAEAKLKAKADAQEQVNLAELAKKIKKGEICQK